MYKAIITGCRGQTGSYMSELLLEEGAKVYGLVRRSSQQNLDNLSDCLENPNFELIEGDIADGPCISGIISDIKPDYLYNFAAQSHVHSSFDQSASTFQINTIGVSHILDAIRYYSPSTKFLQASSSEQFGSNYSRDADGVKYQDENTAFMPVSPYAISKTASHQLVGVYRKAYNISACCSLCFNHESPRRGPNFVTRKITKWIAENIEIIHELGSPKPKGFAKSNFSPLRLGNLDAYRDWGHAKDFCSAIRSIIDLNEDIVVCIGKTYTIRDFLDIAFNYVGITDWSPYVVVDPKFLRPSELSYLKGDCSRLKEKTGWKPKYSLEDIIKEMIEADYSV